MKYNNVTIKGTGSFIPPKILTNKELEKSVKTSDSWIYENLGIKERHISEVLPSNLGYEASLLAIEDANILKDDIDLIIVATSSPDRISPSTACIIHEKLNLTRNIPAFDINAVCTGFIYGLTLAASLIQSGTYENILLIGTETYSRITDWSNRNCVFFGDGAGAVVIGHSKNGWIATELYADGKGKEIFTVPIGGTFSMNGKEVFKQAVEVLPDSIIYILQLYNINISEIDMLVPHQPNINILKETSKKIGLPVEKVKLLMHKYANLAGASIPVGLDECKREGTIKKGNKILLSAVGSGWTWGSAIINYED